jgi:predicted AAA+ superfamily ATPase
MLQYIQKSFSPGPETLYVSLDDLYFTNNRLVDLADDFVKRGGRFLFLDEVHKYPGWSREIKNLYDMHRDLKIVFTGSSMLEIHKGDADLSRRAVVYELLGLSFREYLELEHGIVLSSFTLSDILKNHVAISSDIAKELKPIAAFRNYLKYGYYPYFKENKNTYHQRLASTINLVIEADLPAVERVDYSTVQKLKKLLYIIATSVPFKPNVQKLSEQIHSTRGTTLQYLDYLKNAQLLNLVRSQTQGTSLLNKPDKIYLHNPNLMFALTPEHANIGTQRETFFYNQVKQAAEITTSGTGDFLVNKKMIFEIGGKNKTHDQIKNQHHSYLAVDDIVTGTGNKIPLWLFGFLY